VEVAGLGAVGAVSLIVDTLEGVIDRVAVAIERIQTFEPPEGYYVAFSGGKDSQVVLDLVEQSGVKFDAHMNLTTVDPPELLRFVREHYSRVTLERPETSMYKLIVKKRYPPTRHVRYCCDFLKERGGSGRLVVTGIRWAESSRRKQRRMMDSCFRDGSKTFLHPIIDWLDEDVWEYLDARALPHCELYDQGMTRIGCVMCPMQSDWAMRADAERWPKFAAMYERACVASYDKAITDGLERKTWKDGHDMYRWWMANQPADNTDPQLFPMDN
jgi:phosphoadenosine phosphosulfate reductase